MSENKLITSDRIIEYLKISCQIPEIYKNIYKQQIIKETATEQRITITEEELQKAADRFRVENELLTSEATFKWLKKHSLSPEDFEKLIQQNALATKLAYHLFGDRVEPYFYEHQSDYTDAVIYEIVLNNFDLAMELYYAIEERELSFWDVAYKYIEDPKLRRCRGYQGIVNCTNLKPAVSASIFAAKPPSLLKPISIKNKTYLIYLEEIIYPQLNAELKNEIMYNLFADWLQQKLQENFLN